MKHFFLFALLATFLVTGCGKQVTEVDLNYVGSWYGSDGSATYTLYIGIDSQGTWNKYSGATTSFAEGRATINSSGSKLKVGIKGLRIDQAPTYNSVSGDYTMVLEGVTYYR